MFGKYLNNVPPFRPVGFDQWMANGGGTYIAPSFQMYDIPSVPESAGKLYSWHGTNAAGNYSTAVIGNMSMEFIRKSVAEQKPFMAYIAPKAAHEPFNPAPWYAGHWDDSWPTQEPRPPNWNASFESRKDHHGNIATEPLITDAEAAVITGVFKDRWRTLMSVDDVIGDVIDLCEELKVADNTYFLYPIRLILMSTHLVRSIFCDKSATD
jgi:N-acetylglucosamine-6-sulfatase